MFFPKSLCSNPSSPPFPPPFGRRKKRRRRKEKGKREKEGMIDESSLWGKRLCVCVWKKAMYVRRGIHGAEIYGDIPFLKWRELVMNFVARPPPPCPAHMEKNMPKKIQQSRFGKSCMCVRRRRHIHSVSGRIVRSSPPPPCRGHISHFCLPDKGGVGGENVQ